MRYGIFTKPIHLEKIVNYLNKENVDYFIATTKQELNLNGFDIGVSYCFPYIVDINYPEHDKHIWYNYHPAPLPEYPGMSNYIDAINNRVCEYGVTLHLMDERVDSGKVIKRKDFKLNSVPVHVNELGTITHYYLFQLFKETISYLQYFPKTEDELDNMIYNNRTSDWKRVLNK